MAKKTDPELQQSMPGYLESRRRGSRYQSRGRIFHLKILRTLQESTPGMGNIAEIYRTRVLPLQTRNLHLLGKKAPAIIFETLLGYEVKAAYKRIHCPDLITARYIKVFSELGCRTIRLPYDPTVTAELLPELERALSTIGEGVKELFPAERRLQQYVLCRIYGHLRAQIRAVARAASPQQPGAGAAASVADQLADRR